MTKNKTKKHQKNKDNVYHSIDRVLLLTFPMSLTLLILMLFGQLKPFIGIIAFATVFILTFILALPFLRELEILIHYLKQEASGKTNLSTPKFAKKKREAFRIVEYFNQIKMSWLVKNKVLEAQSLSEGALLETLVNPLLFINADTFIVDANLAARQLLGGGIIFRKLNAVVDSAIFGKAFDNFNQKNEEKEEVEFSLISRNKKKYLKAIFQKLPAQTKNGAITVIILQDVTAFKLFEQSQTDFFANASHELKTPLSVLSGFIETLQTSAKDDKQAQEQFLKVMAEQTTHMTELVQDLLALSRIQTNEEPVKTDRIIVSDLIRSVVQALTLKAKSANKTLKVNILHQTPVIRGKNADLFRVFQNLIDNAIKYSGDKKPITITVELVSSENGDFFDEAIQVSVHNFGNPISPENIEHLTERFYRQESNLSVAGTGLGLAIASEIISLYNGKLDISSSPKHGTNFTVTLPIGL